MGMVNYFNASGSPASGYKELINVAVSFGVGFLTANIAKEERNKDLELLKQMSELDAKQAQRLKGLLKQASTDLEKTRVIIDFINSEKINQLQGDTKKKRVLPLIGLGIAVILLGSLIFYKLHKNNG
jgi:hypothetical protein